MNSENMNDPYSNNNINRLGTVRQVETEAMKRMQVRSLEGEARRIERERRREIRQENYEQRNRDIITAAVAAVLFLGTFSIAPHVAAKIHEWQVEHDPVVRVTDEYSHIISESITGRTPDGYNPVYDYYHIAQNINESDDFDNSLFATYNALSLRTNIKTNTQVAGEQVIEDLDQILCYTTYGNFNNYLVQKDYENVDDWREEMTEKIRLEDKRKDEMQEMQKENMESVDSLGGKSL